MGFILDSSDIIIIILLLVILYEIVQCCNWLKRVFQPPTVVERNVVIETS